MTPEKQDKTLNAYKSSFPISFKFIHSILLSHYTYLTLTGYNLSRKQSRQTKLTFDKNTNFKVHMH